MLWPAFRRGLTLLPVERAAVPRQMDYPVAYHFKFWEGFTKQNRKLYTCLLRCLLFPNSLFCPCLMFLLSSKWNETNFLNFVSIFTFRGKIFTHFLSHVCYMLCPSYPPWIITIIWEGYKLWSSYLRNFLQTPFTAFHLDPNLGPAIAQAGQSPASHWGTPRMSQCEISDGQSGIGAGFLRVLRFPLQILISPSAPQSSSIIRGWYDRLIIGRRAKWI
jgi:hypothetical protein